MATKEELAERIERARRFLHPYKKDPFTEKADDLETIKKAAEDAATVGLGFWLSYLFSMFYIAVSTAQVKHPDLLLENPVKLPFLNLDLDLIAFFILAPPLFVIVHVFTLTKLVLLSEKARRLHQALRKSVAQSEKREKLRALLPSNIFLQFLAGPRALRRGGFGLLLRAIAWLTMALGPILLLLLIQLQFLPYHSGPITAWHRVAVLVDLLLMWWLWRKVLEGGGDAAALASLQKQAAKGGKPGGRSLKTALLRRIERRKRFWLWGGFASSTAALILSFGLATFPTEIQQWPGKALTWLGVTEKWRVSLEELTGGWTYDRVHLEEFNIYEARKYEDKTKLGGREYTVRLKGRHLEYARFDGARLGTADFREVALQDARLDWAQLQGASLLEAQLQGANLAYAQLQGANLAGAQLQGANLFYAQLQGASLSDAQLQGASLDRAQLHGASLDRAKLQGASLSEAQLQGADLTYAQLQGAILLEAQLQGASLDSAQLQGSFLVATRLQGASLDNAQLQGASIEYLSLEASSLAGAFLWRSDIRVVAATNLAPESKSSNWSGVTLNNAAEIIPWTQKDYLGLKQSLERNLPESYRRKQVLELIARLDCETGGKALAPCAADSKPPPAAAILAAAEVDRKTYEKALVKVLGDTVCEAERDGIHVLRGLLGARRSHLAVAGSLAGALTERVQRPDCPASQDLTETDKASLRAAVKEAERSAAGHDRMSAPAPPLAAKVK